MEFERIDAGTVRCILNKEDLEAYNVKIDDFFKNSSNIYDFMHEIIEMAEQEVAYKPDGNMLSMQVALLPENKLALTFYESQRDSIEGMLGHIKNVVGDIEDIIPEKLKEQLEGMTDEEKIESYDKYMRKAIEDAVDESEEEAYRKTAQEAQKAEKAMKKEKQSGQKSEKKVVEKAPSYLRIFRFENLDDVGKFALTVPEKVNVKSYLYKDPKSGYFYLTFEKGRISKVNFERLCYGITDYAQFVSDQPMRVTYMEEHFECMIAKKAIKVMRMIG